MRALADGWASDIKAIMGNYLPSSISSENPLYRVEKKSHHNILTSDNLRSIVRPALVVTAGGGGRRAPNPTPQG
jgi:hypothetical protein